MRVFESNGEEAFQQAGVSQLQVKMVCERPPRSLRSRLPLTRGRLPPQRKRFILPLREEESRRRRQGVAHTPFSNWSWAIPRYPRDLRLWETLVQTVKYHP